ncbi:MAG: hypothetical protein PHR62_10230 [Paludibacter sp.]|nr:hypothetical protein [Paludibacter sp.]
MIDPRIKYYPVENGDTSLITLSDETKILIDINITNDSTNEDEEERYDVLRDLLDNELKKSNKKPYVDVFILTHPDNDHCRGFEKYFFQGNPDDYSDKDKEAELIIINELWYTPRVFEVYTKELNSDAKILKKEAKRRMDLYKDDPEIANTDGNRIRIIGYTDNKDLKGLEDRIVVPGNLINEFNDDYKDDFSMFIHAPFKDTIDGDDANETSIVFQAKFDVDNEKDACLAFWGGDAGWRIWEQILEKSNDEDLNWDLFFAPHHCSWTFFNDNTEDGKKSPQQSSLDILSKKLGDNPKVIVSSKEIKRNNDNPPSYKAKNQYVKEVTETNFWVTSTHSDTTPPEPIEFEIKSTGPQEKTAKKTSNALKSSLITKAASQPKTYGE